jgi:hypothetical protein
MRTGRDITNPQPVRALSAKAETLEFEADAGLAGPTLVVDPAFVAFLEERRNE